MDIDRFLLTNQPQWDRLAVLTKRSGRRLRRLSPEELDELIRLDQLTATHLSYARTYFRDPALVARLTRLVATAGAVVYGSRPRDVRAIAEFLAVTFPAAVWHIRRFVAVSALLTLLPVAAVGMWMATSDDAVNAAAPEAVRQAYIEEDFEEYYSSEPAAEFASTVFFNNVRVAFLAFAAGVLLCVVTAGILVFNGLNLGVALGLFAAAGEQLRFWGLILPHGLLELTAVIVAGASGLRLGWTIIDPGDRPRAAALTEEGRRAVVVAVGLVLPFLVAGLIEGFVTGSTLPTALRVGVGVAAFVAFGLYVVALGRDAASRGITGALGDTQKRWAIRQSDQSRPMALNLR